MRRYSRCDCLLSNHIEVPYKQWSDKARIAFVGESPGSEDICNQHPNPFIGKSGQLLKGQNGMQGAGISLNDAIFLNAARCMVLTQELSDKEVRGVLAACRPKLERALHALKPKVIVCLGKLAFHQITKTRGKITEARGRWLWSDEFNAWVLPTFHPAYCLRDPSKQPILKEDLKSVAEFKLRGWQHPEKENNNYIWKEVQSIQGLLNNPPKLISLDTETGGLDWCAKPPVMLCYSVGIKEGRAAVVRLLEEAPLDQAEFTIQVKRIPQGKIKPIPTEVGVRKCENFDRKIKELIELCEREDIKKAMQNGAFDVHWITSFIKYFADHDLDFQGYYLDTMVAAHVLDENLYTMAPLELLQQQLTDFRDEYWRDFENKYSKEDMIGVPIKDLVHYSGGDADVTLRVAWTIIRKLKKEPRLWNYYRRLVHPALTKALIPMETIGVRIDKEQLPKTKAAIKIEIDNFQKKAISLLPDAIKEKHRLIKGKDGLKLTRRDLLRDAFFTEDGWNIRTQGLKQTKAKTTSFDKEVRQELLLRSIPRRARRFIEIYSKWDTNHTLLTRYLAGFDKYIKDDGRIHTQYNLAKTVTGRSNSARPNMQNNPKRSEEAKKIRKLLAATPGWSLLAIDVSQSELRWIAHIARVDTMIRLFKSGADLHADMAAAIKGVPFESLPEKEAKEARQHAKAINFGGIYGISSQGFVKSAKINYKINISEETAKEYLSILLEQKHPRLRSFHREIVDFCRKHEYVESPFGRKRRLPNIKATDRGIRGEAERQAINSTVQSASSDVVLLVAAELDRKGLLKKDECRLIAFVHDELIFEVKEGLEKKYFRTIKRELENAPTDKFGFKMRVPLVCDGKSGKNLADMETIE